MNNIKPIPVLAALVLLVGLPFVLLPLLLRDTARSQPAASADATKWAAVAPGRIEPHGGEIRIASEMPGRLVSVAVQLNDRVEAGDLLAQTDDSEAAARLAAANAEVNARKLARESRTSGSRADRRQKAEDAAWDSEQKVYAARGEFDRLMAEARAGNAPSDAVVKARTALGDAERDFIRDRNAAAEFAADTQTNASETALAAARAQMAVARAAYERTRIRAPVAGTVLQSSARMGELVANSPEQTLFVLGDLGSLQVRAELEERDVAKARVGQRIVVRTDAYRDRDFPGVVSAVAATLTPARFAPRGAARRQADQDVLEVFATLDEQPPLVSGMRVDVFFAAEPPTAVGSAASNRALP
jgi:HlyD family secretion protein